MPHSRAAGRRYLSDLLAVEVGEANVSYQPLLHQLLHSSPCLQEVSFCIISNASVRQARHVLWPRSEPHRPVHKVEVKVRQLQVCQRLKDCRSYILSPECTEQQCMLILQLQGDSVVPVFGVPQLGGDKEVLSLDSCPNHLAQGLAHFFLIAISSCTVDMPVARLHRHFHCLLHLHRSRNARIAYFSTTGTCPGLLFHVPRASSGMSCFTAPVTSFTAAIVPTSSSICGLQYYCM